jgi:hypothetical protein
MSLDTPIAAPAERNYDPDAMLLTLTEFQLQDLMRLRRIGMNLAEEIDARVAVVREQRDRQRRDDDPVKDIKLLDAAYERVGRMVLQVAAMEQHTLRVRAGQKEKLKHGRTLAKKAEVKRGVEAVLNAAAKIPADRLGPEGARVAALPHLPRENLLNGIFMRYDFSDPRTVAALVAEICGKLGVPFQADIWPVEAPTPEAEPAEPVEPAKAAAKAAAKPCRPPFERGSVSSIGLMAQAPGRVKVPPILARAKGRGPP